MATYTKRTNINGEVSYRIRVSYGYTPDGKQKVKSITWKPDAGMSQRQIKKELDRVIFQLEEQYSKATPQERRVRFADLAEEWLKDAKLSKSLNTSTLERMKGCR